MKKYLLIIFILTSINACSVVDDFRSMPANMRRMVSSYGEKVDYNITADEIKNDTKYAYIIGKMDSRNEWTHIDEKYGSASGTSVIELSFIDGIKANNYDIYKVDAGKFTLTHFAYKTGSTTVNATYKAKNNNEKIKSGSSLFASFNVESGEIYYLGNIYIDKNNLTYEYNNEAMKDYIDKKYPNLKNTTIIQKEIELGTHYSNLE